MVLSALLVLISLSVFMFNVYILRMFSTRLSIAGRAQNGGYFRSMEALPVDNTSAHASRLGVENSSHVTEVPSATESGIVIDSEFAFATLLCDDKLLDATLVLTYSLIHLAKTQYPMIVLALPEVSLEARKFITRLGAHVISTNRLNYPFKLTQTRIRDNKPCR